jgi:hypothetical protein
MSFKPAEWTTATNIGTWAAVVVFVVTLFLSFWGAHLWARLCCLIFGAMLIVCWLFSVKGYNVAFGTICVEHPLWSEKFDAHGIAPENRRPDGGSIRLFASNWIFGDTIGLCYNQKVGAFRAYLTNRKHPIYVETGRGLLVISPEDGPALSRALTGATQTQHL